MVHRGTLACLTCGGPAARGEGVCPWCGAGIVEVRPVVAGPVPAVAVRVRKTYCPHCARLYGSRDAACPRCVPAAAPRRVEPVPGAEPSREAKGSRCPACAGALVPAAVGAVTVDRC